MSIAVCTPEGAQLIRQAIWIPVMPETPCQRIIDVEVEVAAPYQILREARVRKCQPSCPVCAGGKLGATGPVAICRRAAAGSVDA